MKKILFYLTPEKIPSPFDLTAAYDGGADIVESYAGITIEDVKPIVYDIIFPRSPKELNYTAIFIGGHDVNLGEEIANNVVKNFQGLFKCSVVADPDGSNTTSAACIAKVKKAIDLKNKKAIVLAGTGPVGQRCAYLLSKEGCNVTISSRKIEKSKEIAKKIKEIYNIDVSATSVSDDGTAKEAIKGKDIVIATGAAGIQLLKKEIWINSDVKVLADNNAVSPLGIEGVNVNDDLKEIDGKIGIGALAIGALKMKLHHKIIEKLFEKKQIFTIDKIYEIVQEL